jgi:hypothetical protein
MNAEDVELLNKHIYTTDSSVRASFGGDRLLSLTRFLTLALFRLRVSVDAGCAVQMKRRAERQSERQLQGRPLHRRDGHDPPLAARNNALRDPKERAGGQ